MPENGRLSVAVTFFDPLSGENVAYPPFLARPARDGFVCIGVLAARTE